MPSMVRKKILKFYHSLWISRRGVGAVNPTLSQLPPSLSTQVYFDIFSSALNSVRFFSPFQMAIVLMALIAVAVSAIEF